MKKALIIILAISFIFLLGGEFSKRKLFPYGFGFRALLPEIFHIKEKKKKTVEVRFCPREKQVYKQFEFFSHQKIDNIFIGDSVVEFAHSTKLFNLNYDLIAVNGATIDCTKIMLEFIKKIQPVNIIIYLGGNDADGQSNYKSDVAFDLYRGFVNELDKIKSISKIYIVGINLGNPVNRSSNYVEYLNKNLKNLKKREKIYFIKSFSDLDFRDKSFSELSYDGEHLKFIGYKKWFNYLSSQIEDFIYK